MLTYAFWNNKGGTGKTSLIFQAACAYAHKYPNKRVLVIDVCPQANLSELLLGGLTNDGSKNLLARQGETVRATVGGYFQLRLPEPFKPPTITTSDFITNPSAFNHVVPTNIDLVCGDPLLELQANAMSTLANTVIPGTNVWVAVIDWLKDFLDTIREDYDVAFIDANPSFSIYTQIALSTADRLVLPVMADDSSRRAIQNAFSLIYGLRLPSDIYASYAFATRLKAEGRDLPKAHVIAKNRLTQYMGPSSAYDAVLRTIEQDVTGLLKSNKEIFTFDKAKDGLVNIRDFQTTGVVAFARGCPFYAMSAGRLDVMGQRIQVNEPYRQLCIEAIDELVDHL
ncbi:ATPase [Frankia sp. R43]|uniref:ParA family protein n=1 Tax=Frankia sp. R43 TaxID=269536 RepID=UPI0006CA0B8E|nr:AAA family ATPase [Frankia sp. R43]KPM50627.1 ATPase [Frankia sp. R43]